MEGITVTIRKKCTVWTSLSLDVPTALLRSCPAGLSLIVIPDWQTFVGSQLETKQIHCDCDATYLCQGSWILCGLSQLAVALQQVCWGSSHKVPALDLLLLNWTPKCAQWPVSLPMFILFSIYSVSLPMLILRGLWEQAVPTPRQRQRIRLGNYKERWLQLSFLRYMFLSNYLTDLKLHRTKKNRQKLSPVGFELTTSRSSVNCSVNCAKSLFGCPCESLRPL